MNFIKHFFSRIFVTGNNLYQKALFIIAPVLSLIGQLQKRCFTKKANNFVDMAEMDKKWSSFSITKTCPYDIQYFFQVKNR